MSLKRGFRWALPTVAAVGLLVVISSVAVAQAPPGGGARGRGGFGGQNAATLVQIPEVQKELDLVDDQKASLKKINDETRTQMGELFKGFRDLSDDQKKEVQTKLETAQKDVAKKIDDVLLPNQRDRLKEVRIQIMGARALSDADVATALALTDDQKAKIKDIRDAAQKQMREAFQGATSADERTAAREKMTTMRKDTDEKTMAVLTSDQREKFEKMKGKKVDFDPTKLNTNGRRGRQRTAPTATASQQ